MQDQLDPTIVNLAKSIRQAETGGQSNPYSATGDNGTSKGGYQFQQDSWKQWAGKFLGNSNAPMSVENQNKVAYYRIKERKDAGLSPAQIASEWNSGNKDAYLQNHKGTTIINGKKVNFDTPAYVARVSQYYRQLSGQGNQPQQQPQQPYNVPQPKLTLQQAQAQADQAKAEADKANSLVGFIGNFGKNVISNLASSEVGLGKTIGAIAGNNSQGLSDNIQKLNQTQTQLLGLIKQYEAEGKDTTGLKQAYNKNDALIKEQQGSIGQGLPTTGEALGQLGGTALDLLTAGTYGKATAGMKAGELAPKLSKLPTVAQGLKNVAEKPTGLLTKQGLKAVGKGAAIGYGYDVTQGLQGQRGEGRTGVASVIPGLGTVIGAGLPALAEGAQSIKNATGNVSPELKAIQKNERLTNLQDRISPKPTIKEVRLAQSQGRIESGQPRTFFKAGTPDRIIPTSQVKQASEVIDKYIPNHADLSNPELSTEIKNQVENISQKLEPELKKTPIDQETVRKINSELKDTQKTQLKLGDTPDSKAIIKKSQKDFQETVKGTKGRNLNDLWETAKAYDNSIPDNVKNANVNSPENLQLKRQLWLQNRRILKNAINDSSFGLGKTSRQAFSDMTSMYEAQRGLRSRAALTKAQPSKLSELYNSKAGKAIRAVGKLGLGYEALKEGGKLLTGE